MITLQIAITELAAEPEATQMHRQMLGKVRFLGEALIAAGFVADKRSLTRVHTQMVEEVVPLSEEHFATILVAL